MNDSDERDNGTPFQRFLVRVAILIGILILLSLAPFLLTALPGGGGGSSQPMTDDPGTARLSGDPVLLVQDRDDDGNADCLKKIPAVRPFAKGYTANPEARRCSGRGFRPMSDELAAQLTELVRLRTELKAQRGEILDLDGDGTADCIRFGSTRFMAEGHDCPEPADGVQPLSGATRELASRALALETEVRSRLEF
ncbi:MAG: hypothetical protein GY716_20640 [bacterium]|nr:hypothetical protein [bacterium]